MTRLLNANFARLFKSKLFYICAGTTFAFALIEAIKCALESVSRSPHPEEPLFDSSGALLLFCETLLVGIFVGAEHDGALRNKIISGKSRTEIFLANIITCSAAAAMLQFIFMAAALLTGLICGGKFILSFGETALCGLLQLASLIEASVIFSAISLLNQNKFGGTVLSLVVLLALFAYNLIMPKFLDPLKYSSEHAYGSIPMARIEKQNIPEDKIMQIRLMDSVQDVTPFGQQTQIKESFYNAFYRKSGIYDDDDYTKVPIPVEILPYSLGMIAVTTAVGTLVFRKRDII